MQRGYVRVDAISGLVDKVAARHDELVTASALPEVEKRTALRSTELLRRVVAGAQKKQ